MTPQHQFVTSVCVCVCVYVIGRSLNCSKFIMHTGVEEVHLWEGASSRKNKQTII